MESILAMPLLRWFLVEAAQLSSSVTRFGQLDACLGLGPKRGAGRHLDIPAHNELRKATRSLFCLLVKAIWNR
jgi:hypothetical protein